MGPHSNGSAAGSGTPRGELLSGQRRVLRAIANGTLLPELLEMVVHLIEHHSNGLRCAILLADSARTALRFIAAPNVPADYKVNIEPYLRIAPNMGSCGTAAYLRKPVYARDVANDAFWEQMSDIALRNHLRAVWSTPILSQDGDVLGTFALYYGEPKVPDAHDIEIIEMGVQLARVAIESARSTALVHAIFRDGPQAIVVSDLKGTLRRVNPALERLLGYEGAELTGRPCAELLYDEKDRAHYRERLEEVIAGTLTHFTADWRYRRRDGTTVWTHATTSLVHGDTEEPLCLVTMIEDITERRKAEDALRLTAIRLQALSRRMVDLQEAERREISRELHDRVGQTLTALRINMDVIGQRLAAHEDTVIRERNDDSLKLIEAAFKALENVMYELRPPMLDEYGLVASLRWYAKDAARRTGIAIEVRDGLLSRMSPEAEMALFRIAQEAITNVARHARARTAVVELSREDDQIMLAIEDDGIGFPAGEAPADGYGFISMRERAEALGGNLSIESGQGKGARIVVSIPRR